MRVSVFTDEINREEPAVAIARAKEWCARQTPPPVPTPPQPATTPGGCTRPLLGVLRPGCCVRRGITHVEVRSLPGGRFPAVSDAEIEEFIGMVSAAGLAVSGVSPGFCKCNVEDEQVADALATGLPRACEWALRMGTDMVSCFAFDRDDSEPIHSTNVPELVIQRLGEMADITAAHGCRLVLENEAVCWGATGLEAAHICRAVGTDRLGLLWDPGNSCMAGSRAPLDEYAQLKDIVSHVHCKNFADGGWSLMESGVVDWPAQVRALEDDGYDGFLVIETCGPPPPPALPRG